MIQQSGTKHYNFYAVGLSYKKADATLRGKFSLDNATKTMLLMQAQKDGIPGMVIISTCNRTEIYGYAEHPFQLIKLLCENSQGTIEDFEKVAYVHKNSEAVAHIFKVGTGLDSQILGDFEVISQLKTGVTLARQFELVNTFIDRLVNCVIQASKRIKNETEISSGVTSVSFASVRYIMKNIENVGKKNILLFGTGKIGRNTCENLVKHTKNTHITLINRTQDTADKLGNKLHLIVKSYADLEQEIANADILIVATGAKTPTVNKSIINSNRPLLILDLSIPKNVNDNVSELPDVTLVDLDHLSQITDDTLENRKKQVPIAEAIIEEVKEEFIEWTKSRKFVPLIHALKAKLEDLKENELKQQRKKMPNFNAEQAEIISSRILHKVTTFFVNYLKEEDTMADEGAEIIEKIFKIEAKK